MNYSKIVLCALLMTSTAALAGWSDIKIDRKKRAEITADDDACRQRMVMLSNSDSFLNNCLTHEVVRDAAGNIIQTKPCDQKKMPPLPTCRNLSGQWSNMPPPNVFAGGEQGALPGGPMPNQFGGQ